MDGVLLEYVVGLQLEDNFLSVLPLSLAVGFYLFLLPLEVWVLEELSLLASVKQVDPISLSFLVFLLPHFHQLPVAHLLLPVHLLLGPQLLRSGFATDSFLALAKPQNFWLEQRVLDSLRKVHILFIVHPGVVLDGLLYTLKNIEINYKLILNRFYLRCTAASACPLFRCQIGQNRSRARSRGRG